MKLRTAMLCLLLAGLVLLTSCGGAAELHYADGAYRNEKDGTAFVLAPLCYRALSRLEDEEIARIVGTRNEKPLYAIEGMDSALWLTDENFDLYYSESVALPELWEMRVTRISQCVSGAYALPLRTITRSEQIDDVIETYRLGTTVPGEEIIPQPASRYELVFESSDYPGIAYVLEYWTFTEDVEVYAPLNADGSLPDLYHGLEAEIRNGEAVFQLGRYLMYDRVSDRVYVMKDILESYFTNE